jgi:hypothetical protein
MFRPLYFHIRDEVMKASTTSDTGQITRIAHRNKE